MSTHTEREAVTEISAPLPRRASWWIGWKAARRAGRPGSGSRRSVAPQPPPYARAYATATGRCASGAPRSSITTRIPRPFPSCCRSSTIPRVTSGCGPCTRCRAIAARLDENPVDFVPHLIERIERDESIRVRRMAVLMLTIHPDARCARLFTQDPRHRDRRKLRQARGVGIEALSRGGAGAGQSLSGPIALASDGVAGPAASRGETRPRPPAVDRVDGETPWTPGSRTSATASAP